MRVLLIGGAGFVGGLVLPHLRRHHEVRIFDLKRVEQDDTQVVGDATDSEALAAAMAGVDAVIHCAMGLHEGGEAAPASTSFDVNVKSVYLALEAAHLAGVRHAVHVSTMSVYRDLHSRRLDETVAPDAYELYGLTKRLGEQACYAAHVAWGMSVNILRIALPTPDEAWPAWAPPWHERPEVYRAADGTPIHATAGSDLASAMLAALDYRDGCQAFIISGDDSARLWDTSKSGLLLGWEPAIGR